MEKVAVVWFIYGSVKQCEASLVIQIESCSIYRELNRNWKYFSVLEKTFLENTIYCKIILVNNITSIILVNINVFLVLLRPNDLLAENKGHSQHFYFLTRSIPDLWVIFNNFIILNIKKHCSNSSKKSLISSMKL